MPSGSAARRTVHRLTDVYLPKHFTARDQAAVEAFVDGAGAADLVTFDGTKPVASLIPIIWDRPAGAQDGAGAGENGHGRLVGHLALANPQWRSAGPQTVALAIVHGPQAYISPSWYPSTARHGKVVPTWSRSARWRTDAGYRRGGGRLAISSAIAAGPWPGSCRRPSSAPARSPASRFWLSFSLASTVAIVSSTPTIARNWPSMKSPGASLTRQGDGRPASCRAVSLLTTSRSHSGSRWMVSRPVMCTLT